MQVVLVTQCIVLQRVVPARLDDGRIADVQLARVHAAHVLLVGECGLYAFGQLRVLHLLVRVDDLHDLVLQVLVEYVDRGQRGFAQDIHFVLLLRRHNVAKGRTQVHLLEVRRRLLLLPRRTELARVTVLGEDAQLLALLRALDDLEQFLEVGLVLVRAVPREQLNGRHAILLRALDLFEELNLLLAGQETDLLGRQDGDGVGEFVAQQPCLQVQVFGGRGGKVVSEGIYCSGSIITCRACDLL